MKDPFKLLLLVAYILISILTYGHSYVTYSRYKYEEYNECVIQNGIASTSCEGFKTAPLIESIIVSSLWPLYWSTYFWNQNIPKK